MKKLGTFGGCLKKPCIVLVSGLMGSGKTTFSTALCRTLSTKYGFIAEKVSFAGKLKDIARLLGWNGVKDAPGRRLLQHLGDVGREYNVNCWVELMLDYFHGSFAGWPDFIIVDDWRYRNEAEYLQELGIFDIIKVRIEGCDRIHNTDALLHTSEVDLPSGSSSNGCYDVLIYNPSDKDTEFLNEMVTKFCNAFIGDEND